MRNAFRIALAVAVVVGFLAPVATASAQQKVITEEHSGVVLKLSGTTVIVRNEKGEIHKYTGIPAGATVMVDGKPIKFRDLREGMKYTAVRFEDAPPPVVVTMAEVEAMPSTPPPAEAAAPAAAPAAPAAAPAPAAPAAAPAPQKLPSTGSALPMLTWLGVGLLGLGLALGRRA